MTASVKIINKHPDPVAVLVDGNSFILNLKQDDSTAMLQLKCGERLISIVTPDGGEILRYICDFHRHGQYFIYIHSDTIIVSQLEDQLLQPNFNGQGYSGLWYQIASIPQDYERGCDRLVAEYTPLQVHNICYDRDWNVVTDITGKALPVNNPAALRVDFGLTETPVSYLPNYLIHKTDYHSYSLVGSTSGKSFYILSRVPRISQSQYKTFLNAAASFGYDTRKIVANYDTLLPEYL